MVVYFEKMVDRLNCGESMTIFRNISSIVGMTKGDEQNGRTRRTKRKFQCCPDSSGTTLNFRVLQGHCRTQPYESFITGQCRFWTVSSSSLTMLDMQSICIPSSIQGWYQEVKFWATDRPCSFFLWILWTKNASILTRSSWKHRALHIHAESMEETSESWCIGRHQHCSEERIEVSDTIERHHPLRNTSSLLYPESCKVRKLEKPYLVFLQRFPWNMIGWKNWVQKLLVNQMEKLFNSPEVLQSSQPDSNPNDDRTKKHFVLPSRKSASHELQLQCGRWNKSW